jgi:hypothetical protein
MAAAGFAAGSIFEEGSEEGFEEGFEERFAAGVAAAELDAPGALPLAAALLPFSAETVATATARTASPEKIPLSFRMDVVSLVSATVHNPAELAFFLFIVHRAENRAAKSGKCRRVPDRDIATGARSELGTPEN